MRSLSSPSRTGLLTLGPRGGVVKVGYGGARPGNNSLVYNPYYLSIINHLAVINKSQAKSRHFLYRICRLFYAYNYYISSPALNGWLSFTSRSCGAPLYAGLTLSLCCEPLCLCTSPSSIFFQKIGIGLRTKVSDLPSIPFRNGVRASRGGCSTGRTGLFLIHRHLWCCWHLWFFFFDVCYCCFCC